MDPNKPAPPLKTPSVVLIIIKSIVIAALLVTGASFATKAAMDAFGQG